MGSDVREIEHKFKAIMEIVNSMIPSHKFTLTSRLSYLSYTTDNPNPDLVEEDETWTSTAPIQWNGEWKIQVRTYREGIFEDPYIYRDFPLPDIADPNGGGHVVIEQIVEYTREQLQS